MRPPVRTKRTLTAACSEAGTVGAAGPGGRWPLLDAVGTAAPSPAGCPLLVPPRLPVVTRYTYRGIPAPEGTLAAPIPTAPRAQLEVRANGTAIGRVTRREPLRAF